MVEKIFENGLENRAFLTEDHPKHQSTSKANHKRGHVTGKKVITPQPYKSSIMAKCSIDNFEWGDYKHPPKELGVF
jgi:hypothetical protein